MQENLNGKHECTLCGKVGYNMIWFLGSWNCKGHMSDGWLERNLGVDK